MTDREALLKRVEKALAEKVSFEDFPDGVTWDDVAEVELRIAVTAEGSGPSAG